MRHMTCQHIIGQLELSYDTPHWKNDYMCMLLVIYWSNKWWCTWHVYTWCFDVANRRFKIFIYDYEYSHANHIMVIIWLAVIPYYIIQQFVCLHYGWHPYVCPNTNCHTHFHTHMAAILGGYMHCVRKVCSIHTINATWLIQNALGMCTYTFQ